MITIDCSDINELKTDLAAYLAEKLPAVPVIRRNDIVLDPLTDKTKIIIDDVRTYVKTFFARESIDEFIVNVQANSIVIHTMSRRRGEVARPDSGLLTCPHCGLVTPYKEEMDVHIRIHYIF
jgi:hypothetical protein